MLANILGVLPILTPPLCSLSFRSRANTARGFDFEHMTKARALMLFT
jgi:hypothetical protein